MGFRYGYSIFLQGDGYAFRLLHASVLLASSRVFPGAMHPGRSGEYAE